jgi:hypothetical protein
MPTLLGRSSSFVALLLIEVQKLKVWVTDLLTYPKGVQPTIGISAARCSFLCAAHGVAV